MLVISWKMQAEEMCIYTREEWRRGMVAIGVSSTRQLRSKASERESSRKELARPSGVFVSLDPYSPMLHEQACRLRSFRTHGAKMGYVAVAIPRHDSEIQEANNPLKFEDIGFFLLNG